MSNLIVDFADVPIGDLATASGYIVDFPCDTSRADVMKLMHLLAEARAALTAVRDALAAAEKDAGRYRWLRSRMTYYNVDADFDVEGKNIPVLAQVSERIWYHATDDIANNDIDAAIDTAIASEQEQT